MPVTSNNKSGFTLQVCREPATSAADCFYPLVENQAGGAAELRNLIVSFARHFETGHDFGFVPRPDIVTRTR